MNVNLHGKGEFESMIKLQSLRWGGYPGLLRWSLDNHDWGMQEARGQTEGDVMMEAETKVVYIKDEGKDHEPRNADRL